MTLSIEPISTFMDIVGLIPQLYDKDEKEFVYSIPLIKSYIIINDSQLRSQLKEYVGTDLTTTPRPGTPLPREGNQGKGTLLLTDGTELLSVLDDSGVYSQVYTITFTSDKAFIIESDLSGDQGDGTTNADFTTNDTFLIIPKELWKGTFVKDDVHYISIYPYEGMLVHLSSLLAARYMLDVIFTEEVPDASAASQKFGRLYNQLINAIQDGKIFLEKGLVSRNIDPIQIDYEIDQYGQDVTNYQKDEWSRTILME